MGYARYRLGCVSASPLVKTIFLPRTTEKSRKNRKKQKKILTFHRSHDRLDTSVVADLSSFLTFKEVFMTVFRDNMLNWGGGGNLGKGRNAFTLVELLVVIAIIGMLVALLLPAVQAAREAARRMQCTNKLKQLSLAVANFHDTYDRFPASSYDPIYVSNELRSGGFLPLLFPFIEQNALYDAMVQRHNRDAEIGTDARSWQIYNKPSGRTLVDSFLCPSDGEGRSTWTPPAVPAPGSTNRYYSFTNYRASRGDLSGNDLNNLTGYDHDPDAGGVGNPNNDYRRTNDHNTMHRTWLRTGGRVGNIAIVTSGTSNSVAFTEGLIGTNSGSDRRYKRTMASVSSYYNQVPQNCLNTRGSSGMFQNPNQGVQNGGDDHWLGRRAWENWPPYTQVYTLLPPNSPNCASGWQYSWTSASSNHPGGVGVSFLDGSVRFVTDAINVTNLHRSVSGQSPDNPPAYPVDGDGRFSYGVWAELGAVNSTESVSF